MPSPIAPEAGGRLPGCTCRRATTQGPRRAHPGAAPGVVSRCAPGHQLKQFIDTTGPLWQQGKLADKVYGGFTATATLHGGQESMLLSLAHVFNHWGGILVPLGFTDPIQFQVGNPYGASFVAGPGELPGEIELEAASFQARRAVNIAAQLQAGRIGTGRHPHIDKSAQT
jgi:hypothetical protein